MSFLAVSNFNVVVCKENIVDYYNGDEHNILEIGAKEVNDNISDLIISSDGKLLALITAASKQLLVYELPQLKNIKSIVLPRSASKIVFSVNNTQVFVADKTGDVLSYNIANEEGGIKLLGHLSLLLNVLQSNDGKYIITSDRDEKIRVSNYPNTYNIQTYCLGHTEFVDHLELLPHDDKYLISASGDGTIKCWDYLSGSLCFSLDTNVDIDDEILKQDFISAMDQDGTEVHSLPIVHTTLTLYKELVSLVAVAVHSYKMLLIYSIKTVSKNLQYKLEDRVSLENFPAAIRFYNSCLYVYDDVCLKVYKYGLTCNNNNLNLEIVDKIQVFENQNIKIQDNDDKHLIKVLFKRKFDNVQEYQERKKLRIQSKGIST